MASSARSLDRSQRGELGMKIVKMAIPIGSASVTSVAMAVLIHTDREEELYSSHNLPAHGTCVSRESLVDTNGQSGAGVEEELKRDDNDASERGRNNLGLIGAGREDVLGVDASRTAIYWTYVTPTSTRPTEI